MAYLSAVKLMQLMYQGFSSCDLFFFNHLMKLTLLIFSTLISAGCTSEVDKCVNSQMDAWKAEESRKERQISKFEMDKKEVARTNADDKGFTLAEALGLVPTLDKRTSVEVEAEKRLMCLSIINKK